MRMMKLMLVGLVALWPALGNAQDRVSLGDATEHAIAQSQLTLPGGKPFHLRAIVSEVNEPNSDYQAQIEEYWVSATKWRRTIESPDFKQTLVVNGMDIFEKDTGDYFPVWLNHMLTALLNPVPMLTTLKENGVQIQRPHGGQAMTVCGDLHSQVDRWAICFEGSHGLLTSVFSKGYGAEFKDYKKFGEKFVAYRIENDPEPGTKLEERITELTQLSEPSDKLFEVKEPTPRAEQIKSVRISEDTLRSMAQTSTEIDWPAVGGGPETGGCAVYVSADRTGQVREAWPAGCDNTGLEDPLREMVKKWRLKPAVTDGAPVQVEALLGFTFHAAVYKQAGPPELSNEDARNLASDIVEPHFPQGSVERGRDLVVKIAVDETGKLTGIQNPQNLSNDVFFAINRAMARWRFRPYVKDGKAQYFHANISFHVP